MKKIKTFIKDLYVIEPQVFNDDRGYFMESFKNNWFKSEFPEIEFVQDNESKSDYGVLRGLHFQIPPYSQTKLVRVICGEVLDVVVDLRKNSNSYGKYFSIKLSDKNKKQLLVPKGFAHGFIVLSNSAVFSYKVDNVYSKEHDSGVLCNDEDLNINWLIEKKSILISKKDQSLKPFNKLISPF